MCSSSTAGSSTTGYGEAADVGLRHFLLTIPLGALVTTILFLYLIPLLQRNVQWYELYLMVVAVNVAVAILAYVLMPQRSLLGRRS